MIKIQGVVRWFDQKYGQGIAEDLQGNEYYIDSSVLKRPVKSGDKAQWVINEAIKNCLCGKEVEVIK